MGCLQVQHPLLGKELTRTAFVIQFTTPTFAAATFAKNASQTHADKSVYNKTSIFINAIMIACETVA